jgi:hypothetical protein
MLGIATIGAFGDDIIVIESVERVALVFCAAACV